MMTDDDEVIERMAAEMATKGACEFHFTAASMLRAVALMQLALRHPKLDESHRRFARTFIEHGRHFFIDCPTVLNVIARGDNPAEDR
jgi:dihydroxyacid dehydratase/phosphogluconate dehydratase